MLFSEGAGIIGYRIGNKSYGMEITDNAHNSMNVQFCISDKREKLSNLTSNKNIQPSVINANDVFRFKKNPSKDDNEPFKLPKVVMKENSMEYERPIIEGWLHKWTNMVNTWRPRYFILYPGVICYIKGSKIIKKNISNKFCYIDIYTSKCSRISVRYPNSSTSDLHLRACSFESKLVWTNSLFYSMNAVMHLEKVQSIDNTNSAPETYTNDSLGIDVTPFLTHLLYDLIKTRSLVLDELMELKTKSIASNITKYFDKLIDVVFKKTCNFNFIKFHKGDIYSSLFGLISANGNILKNNVRKDESFHTKEFSDEIFYDAFSDIENDTQSDKALDVHPSFPTKNDCSYCFWKKNPYKYRMTLPFLQQKPRFSLWASIKESITKDISRITVPIQFNEPTSLLQRLAEDFRYSSILENAAFYNSSIDRLREITIFSITPYVSSVGRIFKPFNPLLGETFEFSHRGFRFIAEQVGHHPPITAFYVEHHPTDNNAETPKIGHKINPLYSAWGHVGNKSRFTGQSLELTVLGNVNIALNGDDYYTFNRPKLLIHNIIFGKLWIEIVGISIIKNKKTSEFSLIEYQKGGWFSNDLFNIKGFVFDKYGRPIYKIGGKWDSKIWYESCKLESEYEVDNSSVKVSLDSDRSSILKDHSTISTELSDNSSDSIPSYSFNYLSNWEKVETIPSSRKVAWVAESKPFQSEKFFGFAEMTFELNEISPQYDNNTPGVTMPCTDSRYRPDQRAYENGHIEWAIKEKRRLEEKQRACAKRRINGEADYCPRCLTTSIGFIRTNK
ncbi:oxysterol binding protein 1A-like pleckstrin homology domain-containing protein [Cryptosporidium canis]|uniref:Oxysterol binding protein 1A-like pleckstrin homology domain-containing protein n=1 Tax=Cryptosporidium canis TaxID=195482 RepID=A0A9D5DHD0_9CRYT|nr:oxysterol binding protein 1A-like pleckstrin homology domain-containing protein [Cryptosporidium canis]